MKSELIDMAVILFALVICYFLGWLFDAEPHEVAAWFALGYAVNRLRRGHE